MEDMKNHIRLLEKDVVSIKVDILEIKDLLKEMKATLEGLQTFIIGSNETIVKTPVSSFGKTAKRGREKKSVVIELDSSDDNNKTSKGGTGKAGSSFSSPSTPMNRTVKRKVKFSTESKEFDWKQLEYLETLPNHRLFDPETNVFEWLYDLNANLEEVVVDFPSWQLNRGRFICLLGSRWVSSDVMNAWCAYLNVRQTGSCSVKDKDRNFYYCTRDESLDYLGINSADFDVESALKYVAMDFGVEEYRRWFVAIASKGHWWLYVFDLHNKTVMILDSLGTNPEVVSGGLPLLKQVATNVDKCLSYLGHSCMKQNTGKNWTTRQRVEAPQQYNCNDCGAYVMRYMDLWDGDWLKEKFSQDDIGYIRHHMAVKMVMSEENIARPWHRMVNLYIDVNEIRANTEYGGYTNESRVIQWFWEIFQGFNDVDKARLLQFVTGTSKVPFEGFSKLQGLSGVQKFQIHKPDMLDDELPFARTSYNRLELPDYESKQILKEKLLLALKEAKELTAKKSRREWRGRRVVSRS